MNTASAKRQQRNGALRRLFRQAEDANFYEYLYTIVRVDGVHNRPDKLADTDDRAILADEDAARELLVILYNLLRVVRGESYELRSFTLPAPGSAFGFERVPLPDNEVKAVLVTQAKKSRLRAMPRILELAFEDPTVKGELLAAMLSEYKAARKRIATVSHLFMAPSLGVGEFFANETVGVYGFKVHWPDGGESHYCRTARGSECCNIDLGSSIVLSTGGSGQPWDEPVYKGKPLFETGLPGRYNPVGRWKPIVYPGNADMYEKQARALSGDHEVQSCLYYIMCTGHRCIEFAMRTPITFSVSQLRQFVPIELLHCKVPPPQTLEAANESLYDGTVYLTDISPEMIRMVLDDLHAVFSKLAFVFGCEVKWCLKYSLYMPGHRRYVVKAADMNFARRVFNSPMTRADSAVLDAAIGWSNFATHVESPLSAFVAHVSALETLAHSIAANKADFGIASYFQKLSETEREACIARCEAEADTRAGFVKQAYAECVDGVIETLRCLFRALYGQQHEYFYAMFKRVASDKDPSTCSLYSLRSKISHGDLSPASSSDRKVVRDRITAVQEIVNNVLIRLALGLSKRQRIPKRTWQESKTLPFADPRGCKVASHHHPLRKHDWRIRREWIP